MFIESQKPSPLHLLIQKLDNFRLRLHFKVVDQRLRLRDTRHLSEPARRAREQHLTRLRAYGARGIFPRNETHPDFRPCFIDRAGRECAVAHLLIEAGQGAFAQHIVATNNPAFVREMDYPEIDAWGEEAGFTKEELQIIQPAYPPSADEMAMIRLMQLGVQLSGMVILLGMTGFLALVWKMVKPNGQDGTSVPGFLQSNAWKVFLWQNKMPLLLVLPGLGLFGLSAYLKLFPQFMEYSMWSDFQQPDFISILQAFLNKLNGTSLSLMTIALVNWGLTQLRNQNKPSLVWNLAWFMGLVVVGIAVYWMAINYLALSEVFNPSSEGYMFFSRTLIGYCLEHSADGFCP